MTGARPARRRTGAVFAAMFAAVLAASSGTGTAGAECVFGGLQWNTDGTRLQFQIGHGAETRRASVEVATGNLTIEDARVREPVSCSRRGTIVFRDLLGVCECAAQGSDAPRLLLPAPENGAWFVRAYGEDKAGAPVVWLYDPAGARHVFWTAGRAGGAAQVEPLPSGAEALRAWEARQQGSLFARAGQNFKRSVCARFRGRKERACLEPLAGVADQSYRLTLGLAGAVAEWTTHVWPCGFSMAPDSAVVLVGLIEEDHGAARCATWIVGPERAKRIGSSPAHAGTADPESWVQWADEAHALWADAAGALWSIDAEAWTATPRCRVPDAPPPAPPAPPSAGATSPAVTGPRGVRAWVRAVRTANGVDCELWADPGSGARRVVAPLAPPIGG